MTIQFSPKSLVLTIAALAMTLPVIAQWQWVDKEGRKVFSDRAPPADIKEKDILKRPGAHSAVLIPAADQTIAAAAALRANAASAPQLATKDSELELRKKQAEKDEALQKKAADDKQAKVRQENCDRARVALVTLQSGIRMATTNAAGEREVMDDTKRGVEAKRVKEVADTNCKS